VGVLKQANKELQAAVAANQGQRPAPTFSCDAQTLKSGGAPACASHVPSGQAGNLC
jgi:hypothetical protein